MIRIEDIVEKVAHNHRRQISICCVAPTCFPPRTQRPEARLRRVVPGSPARSGKHSRRHEARRSVSRHRPAARRRRRHARRSRHDSQILRRRDHHLVDGLTKIAQISNISREEQQAENVRKMLLAMVDDVRVVLVKLADRLHNMRTLQYLNPEKRKRIAEETMDIFAPIAHRLGMGKLRGELEDLAFRHLHPEDYRELAEQLEKRRPRMKRFLKGVTARIEEKMNEAEVPFVLVEGRVKRLYSIWKKLRAQKITWTRSTIWSRRESSRRTKCVTVTRRSVWSITTGNRCRAASKTGLPRRATICTSRCTPR
jgi:hypothetical protein